MKDKKKNLPNLKELKKDILFSDNLLGNELNFQTTWGLFSPKSIDDGTKLLLKKINFHEKEEILDLGCGYGPIGLAISKSFPNSNCLMVDKDFVAIEYAKKNIKLNKLKNASALLSNGLQHISTDQKFSLILTNLPAKTNKENYYIFFYDILNHLEIDGRMYVVAINGLRKFISKSLLEVFGNYKKIKQSKTYTVSMAIKKEV